MNSSNNKELELKKQKTSKPTIPSENYGKGNHGYSFSARISDNGEGVIITKAQDDDDKRMQLLGKVSSEILPIYKSTFELADEIIEIAKSRPPKILRYSLCERMIDTAIDMAELITRANMTQDEERVCVLNEFAIKVASLRAVFVLHRKHAAVPAKRESKILELLESVGKQSTGWKKKARSTSQDTTAQ